MHKTQPLNKPHHWITITLLAIFSYSTAWANTNNGFTLEQGDLEVVDGTVKAPRFVGGGSTPIGSVIAFMGMEVPNGWMTANGAEISRAEYSELFSAIGVMYGNGNNTTTFNIPDLRGEFIRGWDDGRGVDTGRQLGSYQTDALQNITGSFRSVKSHVGNATGAFTISAGSNETNTGTHIAGYSNQVNFDASDVVRTAGETRSRNIAVMYIIRVK